MIKITVDTTGFSGEWGGPDWHKEPAPVKFEFSGCCDFVQPRVQEVDTNLEDAYFEIEEQLKFYLNHVLNNEYLGSKMVITINAQPVCVKCDSAFEQAHFRQDKCDNCILVECERCGSYYPFSENTETICKECE